MKDSNKENLKVIINTLPNKSESPESLKKNNHSSWKAFQLMCT